MEGTSATSCTWKDGQLHLMMANDLIEIFPIVWLRDNCPCSECHDNVFMARLVNVAEIDREIKTAVLGDASLCISWEDGHTSVFNLEWLTRHSFREQARKELHAKNVNLWGSELQEKIPTHNFRELLEDDNALLAWMNDISQTGICLIQGAPVETGQVKRIGRRVGFIRKTMFGEIFQVRYKEGQMTSVAYTGRRLALHTDLASFSDIPGIQMLHCVSQTLAQGGENQFVDGFHVANILRHLHPDYFETLSTTPIDFADAGNLDNSRFHIRSSKSTFSLDTNGQLTRVVVSDHQRDHYQNLPLEKVEPLYRALIKLNEIMYCKTNYIEHKLKPGEIVCLDNYRVLHGRSSYTVGEGGARFLEGGYIDWDELNSKMYGLENSYTQM